MVIKRCLYVLHSLNSPNPTALHSQRSAVIETPVFFLSFPCIQLTNILALLSQLPSLLPNARTHLPKLLEFYTTVIAPHVEGTSAHGPSSRSSSGSGSTNVVTSNGLLRKMAVKARGRWWIAMLETTMGHAGKARRRARGRHVVPIQRGGMSSLTWSLVETFLS
jgi:hypothetical protein